MEKLTISYGGTEIPFVADLESGSTTLINATKMLECFPGKKMNNFLRNQTTKERIEALSRIEGIPVSEILVVQKAGNKYNQGTWMHEDLAIEFARWLDPDFGVWCNRKIRELFENGVVSLESELDQEEQNTVQQQKTHDSMLPFADYGYDIMELSQMTYSTTELVKGFSCSISVQEVFNRLIAENYVGHRGNSTYWFLKAPYDKMGCTRLVSKVVEKNGQPKYTVNQVRWTEYGRAWLASILFGWRVIQNPISHP